MKVSASQYQVITVCINHRSNPDVPSCGARDAAAIACWLEQAVAGQSLPLRIERFKCLGKCELGPNIKLTPGGFLHRVTLEALPALLQEMAAKS